MSYGGGQDEIQRLIMQVEGEAKVERLTKDLEAQMKAMKGLEAQYKDGRITMAQYTVTMEKMAQAAMPIARDLGTAQKGVRNMGSVLMQAGYIVDDFTAGLNQRGLAGALANVQNNIPGFLLSLGKGAGLAGVVGIAGVAVSQLVQHWGDIKKLWEDGSTEKEIERQKELQKAVDGTRKALDAQIDALRKAEHAGKPEQAEIVHAAIDQAGGVDEVLKQVTAKEMDNPDLSKAREKQRYLQDALIHPDPNVSIVDLDQKLAAANARVHELENMAIERAKTTVAGAAEGKTPSIERLAQMLPGAAFDQATPEAIRKQDAEIETVQKQGDAMHRRAQKRNADNARAADLNKAAQDNVTANEEAERKANDAALRLPKDDLPRQRPVDESKAQPDDAMEAALLRAEHASLLPAAQVDDAIGFQSQTVQRVEAIASRLEQLYARNSRNGGGQVQGGWGSDSALPVFQGN